ncbi:ABC transporter permease [Thermoproteus uzoniensis]|nr:ABC transporter permease [Thermoproteus uzoniensis]
MAYRHITMLATSDMRARKARYLLLVVVIAIGAALMVALSTISVGAKIYVKNQLYQIFPADILIYSNSINIPYAFVSSLRSIPYVQSAEPVVMLTGTLGNKTVTLLGVPLSDIGYFDVELQAGRLPHAGGEAVVESTLGVPLGRDVTIYVYQSSVAPPVKLKATVVGIMSNLLKGFIGPMSLNLVVVPLDWLQQQMGIGDFYNMVFITLKDKSLIQPLAQALKQKYPQAEVYTQQSALSTINRVFNMLNIFFLVIEIIAFLAGVLTTFTVMSITVRERIGEIALLKATGISGRDIALAFVLEVASVGFLGGVAGGVVGYFGALGIKYLLIKLGYFFDVPIPFMPSLFALGVFLSLLVALAGALMPIYRAVTLRPLEILR